METGPNIFHLGTSVSPLRLLPFFLVVIQCFPLPESFCQERAPATDFFTASAFRNVEIASQESGIVKKMLIKEGSKVIKDQPIVELNRRLFELESARSLAEFNMAELEKTSDADLRFAQKNTKYNEVLLKRFDSAIESFARSVSKTEREQAFLELQKSKLSVEQALLQLEIADEKSKSKRSDRDTAAHRLELRSIKSSLDGTVVEILVDEGEWVQAGQALTRVVDFSKLKIKGYVPAEQFSISDVGKKVQFRAVKPRVDGDPKFEATITFVSPEIEPKFFSNPKVRIIAEMENPDLKIRINSEMRMVK